MPKEICPRCQNENVKQGHKYCGICGLKLIRKEN